MKKKLLVALICIILAISFITIVAFWRTPDGSAQTQSTYSTEVAFPNLTFNFPDGLMSPGDGTNRLFVTEQTGKIIVFENNRNTTTSKIFLDVSDRVLYGGEQGLLGLAFHPNYEKNGYFYVNYDMANPRRTIISRFHVTASDPDTADKNSEQILLEVNQPFENHKGGQLAFGADGYLYIGLGDGGSGGDPFGNGQNRGVLLGKVLRIYVDSPSQGRNYSIPADNPFVGNTLGYREEIYAYGFRNPWRFSFDESSEKLWVADVGQDQREEIDLVEKGKNYGWNIMEGSLTYSSGSQVGLVLPVWEYGHDQGDAIIGGYVYHGSTLTGVVGSYVYGDYGSGRIWAFTLNATGAPTNSLLNDTSLSISSFGVDAQNELYICAFDGKIYKLSQTNVPEFSSLAIFAVLLMATLLLAFVVRKRGNHFSFSNLREAT